MSERGNGQSQRSPLSLRDADCFMGHAWSVAAAGVESYVRRHIAYGIKRQLAPASIRCNRPPAMPARRFSDMWRSERSVVAGLQGGAVAICVGIDFGAISSMTRLA